MNIDNDINTTTIKKDTKELRKRIGSTNFIVNVHFSNTSTETLKDKVHRLIESEVAKSA